MHKGSFLYLFLKIIDNVPMPAPKSTISNEFEDYFKASYTMELL